VIERAKRQFLPGSLWMGQRDREKRGEGGVLLKVIEETTRSPVRKSKKRSDHEK